MANRPHRRPRTQLAPSLIAIAAALLVIFLAAAIMYVLMPLITISEGGTASNAISAPRTAGASPSVRVSPTLAQFDIEAPEATNTPTFTSTPPPTEPPAPTPFPTATTAALALATTQPPAPTYGAIRWRAASTATTVHVAGASAPTDQPIFDIQPSNTAPSSTATATPTATISPSPTATATPNQAAISTVESATEISSVTPEPTPAASDAETTGRRPHTRLAGSPIAN